VTGGKFANGAASAAFSAVVQSVGAGLGSEAKSSSEATEAYGNSEREAPWTEAEANAIDAQIRREQQQSQRAAIELSEGKGSSSGMSVFGKSSQGDVATGFQDISNGLANLDSSQIGKMSYAQNNKHGGTALAVAVDKTKIYLSKTYVNGLLEGQRGTTFIHEMGHLLGWSHKHMDWNLTLNVSHTTSLISSGNRFGNLRNPYAYEWYLNN
jgi:predicted GNAT family acetyltransferase